MHPEKLNDLYCSPNIHMNRSRIKRLAGHVAHMGEMRGAYRILVRKPQGQIPLGRQRLRWEDNIKKDLQVGC